MATNKETPSAGTLGEPDYSNWSIDEIFAEFRRTQQAINEQSNRRAASRLRRFASQVRLKLLALRSPTRRGKPGQYSEHSPR